MKRLSEKTAIVTGDVKGIGKAISSMLTSDDATFVTGSELVIDGGYTAQ